jgi:hypothetical protein
VSRFAIILALIFQTSTGHAEDFFSDNDERLEKYPAIMQMMQGASFTDRISTNVEDRTTGPKVDPDQNLRELERNTAEAEKYWNEMNESKKFYENCLQTNCKPETTALFKRAYERERSAWYTFKIDSEKKADAYFKSLRRIYGDSL